MMSSNPSEKPQRRYGAALEQAILDAAWDELNEVGYKQLTFDNVARRAGTSRPVLYRRWPTRLDLVRAALRTHRPLLSGDTPDTGSLRGDVIALLEYTTSALSGTRRDIIWGMVSDAIGDEEQQTAAFGGDIAKRNVAVMRTVLQKAEARGEVVAEAVPDYIVTLPIDLMRHEMLISGRVVSKVKIRKIVDDIFLPAIAKTQGK